VKDKKDRKNKKLTLKQSKLLKELPASGSVAEAGEKAGYFDRQTAHRALKTIAERTPEVLEQLGLTIEYVADKCLRPLLEAKETKFFASNGIVMEEREVAALDVRLRAIEVWAKLAGANTQKVEVGGRIEHGIDLTGVPEAVLHGIVGLAAERSAGSSQSKG
jgi:hypothetical protein